MSDMSASQQVTPDPVSRLTFDMKIFRQPVYRVNGLSP